MKIILLSIVCLAAMTHLSLGHPMAIKNLIDETNLTDSHYRIQSLVDGLFIGAVNETSDIYHCSLVSAETVESAGDPDKIKWNVYRAEFQQEDDPYRYRQMRTFGPNGYNVINLENPSGFPIDHFWRLRNWGEGVFGVNSILQFDFDNVGQNKCLQNNGLSVPITFEECEEMDLRQQWTFVDVSA